VAPLGVHVKLALSPRFQGQSTHSRRKDGEKRFRKGEITRYIERGMEIYAEGGRNVRSHPLEVQRN